MRRDHQSTVLSFVKHFTHCQKKNTWTLAYQKCRSYYYNYLAMPIRYVVRRGGGGGGAPPPKTFFANTKARGGGAGGGGGGGGGGGPHHQTLF